jgi:hypothetical protein
MLRSTPGRRRLAADRHERGRAPRGRRADGPAGSRVVTRLTPDPPGVEVPPSLGGVRCRHSRDLRRTDSATPAVTVGAYGRSLASGMAAVWLALVCGWPSRTSAMVPVAGRGGDPCGVRGHCGPMTGRAGQSARRPGWAHKRPNNPQPAAARCAEHRSSAPPCGLRQGPRSGWPPVRHAGRRRRWRPSACAGGGGHQRAPGGLGRRRPQHAARPGTPPTYDYHCRNPDRFLTPEPRNPGGAARWSTSTASPDAEHPEPGGLTHGVDARC